MLHGPVPQEHLPWHMVKAVQQGIGVSAVRNRVLLEDAADFEQDVAIVQTRLHLADGQSYISLVRVLRLYKVVRCHGKIRVDGKHYHVAEPLGPRQLAQDIVRPPGIVEVMSSNISGHFLKNPEGRAEFLQKPAHWLAARIEALHGESEALEH